MSAIARYMLKQGVQVFGYDKTKTTLTRKLEAEGMMIHYDDDPIWIPEGIDLVVYTPAIPDDHKELNWFVDNGYNVIKRAEMLGWLSERKKTVAVAGTHGKTSTSSTIAHILKYCKQPTSAFIGGIMVNYDSNYIGGDGDWLVVEADEYDRSFLWLQPNITVVMSMDADHLDIYGKHTALIDGFNQFIQQTNRDGHLIILSSLLGSLLPETLEVLKENNVTIITFDEEAGDVQIREICVKDGKFCFDLVAEDTWKAIVSNMPGRHNVENTTAAILVAKLFGLGEVEIREALLAFKGIKRRFERIVETDNVVYIDDYAHHPSELRAAIAAARMLYPEQKILGIFQPHLYSRTSDFADGFAEELDKLDEVLLMDIYPARELPMEGVTSQMILDRMKNEHKQRVTKASLIEILKTKKTDVILTLGAGDIDVFVPQIKEMLTETIE